jgi:hypothetical protein
MVFIVNTNGINFSPTSRIDTGSLIASTLNIKSEDFLNNNYKFYGDSLKAIVNNGNLIGNNIALLSNHIENNGIITAKLGKAALLSGNEITLSIDNNGLIGFCVDKPIVESLYDEGIVNSGTIEGSIVFIEAKALQDILLNCVNNKGIIKANSVTDSNGVIEITSSGNVTNKGLIDSSSIEDNVAGGDISVRSGKFLQDGIIKANAHNNSSAGYIELLSEDFSIYTNNSLIEAKGLDIESVGGNVYINTLNGDTIYKQGALTDVSGGIYSGNAGQLEISAKGALGYYGSIKGTAAEGYTGGSVLFDPYDIVIQNGGADSVTGGDDITFNNPDEAFAEDAGLTLTFDPQAGGAFNGFANIYLQATNDITVNSDFDANIATGNAAGVHVTLEANNDINLNADIITNNAYINLYADNNLNQAAASHLSCGTFHMFLYADADENGSGTLTRAAGSTITNTGNLDFKSASLIETDSVLAGLIGANSTVTLYTTNDNQITVNSDLSNMSMLSIRSSGGLLHEAGSDIDVGSVYLYADYDGNGTGTLTRQVGSTITMDFVESLLLQSGSDLSTSSILTGCNETGSLTIATSLDFNINIDSDLTRAFSNNVYINAGGDLLHSAGSDIDTNMGQLQLNADNNNNGIGTLTREVASTIDTGGTLYLKSGSDISTNDILTGCAQATGALVISTTDDNSITIDCDISRNNKWIYLYSSGDLTQKAGTDIDIGWGALQMAADYDDNGIGTLTREATSTISDAYDYFFSSASELTSSELLSGVNLRGDLDITINGNTNGFTIDADLTIDDDSKWYVDGYIRQLAGTTIIAGPGDGLHMYADYDSDGTGALIREGGSFITTSTTGFYSSGDDIVTSELFAGWTKNGGNTYVYSRGDANIIVDSDLQDVGQYAFNAGSNDFTQTTIQSAASISADAENITIALDQAETPDANYFANDTLTLQTTGDLDTSTFAGIGGLTYGTLEYQTTDGAITVDNDITLVDKGFTLTAATGITQGNDIDTGTGAVTMTTDTGNILLGDVTCGDLTLTATTGNILDNNADTDNVTSGGTCSMVAGGYIGTDDDPLDVNINGGTLDVDVSGENNGYSSCIGGTILPDNTYTYNQDAPGQLLLNDNSVVVAQASNTVKELYQNEERPLYVSRRRLPLANINLNIDRFNMGFIDISGIMLPNMYEFSENEEYLEFE